MVKEDKITKITKFILDIMFYSGSLICFLLPFIFKFAGKWYPTFQTHYISMCVLFFISGILAVFIIKELRKMFQTVMNENCFIEENVKSLKKMAKYSLGISIVTSIRLWIIVTPATLIIRLVFFIAGLFSQVLSKVFEQAVQYKIENDLTI